MSRTESAPATCSSCDCKVLTVSGLIDDGEYGPETVWDLPHDCFDCDNCHHSVKRHLVDYDKKPKDGAS